MRKTKAACAALAVLATTFCGAEAARRDYGQTCYPDHTDVSAAIPGADPHYTHYMTGHRHEKCWYDARGGTPRTTVAKARDEKARTRAAVVIAPVPPPEPATTGSAPPAPPPLSIELPTAAAMLLPLQPPSVPSANLPEVAAASAGLRLRPGEAEWKAARQALREQLLSRYASLNVEDRGDGTWR